MITRDLRDAIGQALGGICPGMPVDPGLRPGGEPGQYSSSAAFAVAKRATPGKRATPSKRAGPGRRDAAAPEHGIAPGDVALALARHLREHNDWIAEAEATGPGYVTVTVTPQALRDLPRRMTEAAATEAAATEAAAAEAAAAGVAPVGAAPAQAAIAVARSDVLRGQEFRVPEPGAWERAATWASARDLLHAEVTGNLAAAAGGTVVAAGQLARGTVVTAAGATVTGDAKAGSPAGDGGREGTGRSDNKAVKAFTNEPAPLTAVAFAGTDAAKFALARTPPGTEPRIDQRKIARQHPGNPAYAVRYAHARAVSGQRWAVALGTPEAGPQRLPAHPAELTLLDALSWLPERVAVAARRGRPDEFARYLERLAEVTLEVLTAPGGGNAPGSDRLALAMAARTGLAAGLALLGVHAPDRL